MLICMIAFKARFYINPPSFQIMCEKFLHMFFLGYLLFYSNRFYRNEKDTNGYNEFY